MRRKYEVQEHDRRESNERKTMSDNGGQPRAIEKEPVVALIFSNWNKAPRNSQLFMLPVSNFPSF